jgi:ATP-dependent Clp protease ATP-binding subunit ClpA
LQYEISDRAGVAFACGFYTALASLEEIRQRVDAIIGQGEGAPSGHIAFTPRAKKALEFGLREALQLGERYIGTEHHLLALIREGEGVAAQVLVTSGADLNRARQQVIALLRSASDLPARTCPGFDEGSRQLTRICWSGREG